MRSKNVCQLQLFLVNFTDPIRKSQQLKKRFLLFLTIYKKNIQLIKSDNIMALKVKKENTESIQRVKNNLSKILEGNADDDEKIQQIAILIVEGHNETQSLLQKGFLGLAVQNETLNQELVERNEALENRIKELQQQFQIVVEELEKRKEKERMLEEQKQKRKNRKRLPKKQPITIDIYNFLIENSQKQDKGYGRTYMGARLRISLALLAVTGIRVSELLPLKMNQVQNLFVNHWIKIDRSKRGPASHKAFLTREGIKIMRDRLPDFEFM